MTIKPLVLSSGNYYEEGAANLAVKVANSWNTEPVMKELLSVKSEFHYKTVKLDRLRNAMIRNWRQSEEMWRRKLYSKWVNLNFHVQNKKRSVKQRHVNCFLPEDGMPMPIIYFGDGKWNPGMKGTRSVPQDMIDVFLRAGFPVIKTGEYRTRCV